MQTMSSPAKIKKFLVDKESQFRRITPEICGGKSFPIKKTAGQNNGQTAIKELFIHYRPGNSSNFPEILLIRLAKRYFSNDSSFVSLPDLCVISIFSTLDNIDYTTTAIRIPFQNSCRPDSNSANFASSC
jgi:hypothetical protein